MTFALEIEAAFIEYGQDVTLRRVGTPNIDTTGLRARVDNFQPHELVGGVLQGDRKVSIGTVTLTQQGWPQPPRKGDVMLIDGKTTTIQGCEAVNDGTETVRYNMTVRGS